MWGFGVLGDSQSINQIKLSPIQLDPPKLEKKPSLPKIKPIGKHLNYNSSYDQRIKRCPIQPNPLINKEEKEPPEKPEPKAEAYESL